MALAEAQAVTNMAHWAERYADRLHWAVLPLHGIRPDGRCRGCAGEHCAGKHPIPRHWDRSLASAKAAPGIWREDLAQRGIGLVCGPKSGVWVLDVDLDTGGVDSLAQLEHAHGQLPCTWRARTGTGGQHFFFRATDDSIRNSASQVMPGLDVRGAGGYVVLPPSPHHCGNAYEWIDAPLSVPLADAPGWLTNLATMRPRRAPLRRIATAASSDDPFIVAAGHRHDVLVRQCGWLRSMGWCEDAIVVAARALIQYHFTKDPPMDLEQAERDMRDVARRYPPTAPGSA